LIGYIFHGKDKEAGPALGIGRECDSLGPMPLGGP